eukprot:m.250159 g.250159  ORF g.250159 m.250159 type:complete len:97 (+) comp40311_c0_seq5:672-962(+)
MNCPKVQKTTEPTSKSFFQQTDVENWDDKRIKFYTGIQSGQVLKTLFDYMKDRFEFTEKRLPVSKNQLFIAVLSKMRLNLMDKDIACLLCSVQLQR